MRKKRSLQQRIYMCILLVYGLVVNIAGGSQIASLVSGSVWPNQKFSG